MHKTFGLIGYPLKNTFSKNYFTEKFRTLSLNYTYENFEISAIDEVLNLKKFYTDLAGFNVTKPYKQSIIPYLHRLDDIARQVGAVNCVAIHNHLMVGFNTDVEGFEKSFIPWVKPILNHNPKALVLGSGGASKAVQFVLNKLGIAYQIVSRNGILNYENLNKEIITAHKIIINCTPLGMFPDVNATPPIPYTYITSEHFCYDLIYLPAETLFLQKTAQQGAKTKNGLEMLHLQAEAAWRIWQTELIL